MTETITTTDPTTTTTDALKLQVKESDALKAQVEALKQENEGHLVHLRIEKESNERLLKKTKQQAEFLEHIRKSGEPSLKRMQREAVDGKVTIEIAHVLAAELINPRMEGEISYLKWRLEELEKQRRDEFRGLHEATTTAQLELLDCKQQAEDDRRKFEDKLTEVHYAHEDEMSKQLKTRDNYIEVLQRRVDKLSRPPSSMSMSSSQGSYVK